MRESTLTILEGKEVSSCRDASDIFYRLRWMRMATAEKPDEVKKTKKIRTKDRS
jgi:hypothetical protein